MDNLDNYTMNSEDKKEWMNNLKKFYINTHNKYINSEFSDLDIEKNEDYFNAKIRIADGVGSWTNYIDISPKQLNLIKAILLK